MGPREATRELALDARRDAPAARGADVERVMTAAGIAAGLEATEAQKAIASAFKSVTKARPVPPPKPRYSAREDTV